MEAPIGTLVSALEPLANAKNSVSLRMLVEGRLCANQNQLAQGWF